MRITVLVSFFLVLFISAVSGQSGQEISVKVGETKTASKSGFKANFISVLEDSRCPEGANCIWAGQARIKVTIETKDGQSMNVELSTNGENQSVQVATYLIHLVKLTPQPSAQKAPEEKEYSAWFRFEKN